MNGVFVVQEAAVCGTWLVIKSHKGNCLVLRKSVALAIGHRVQALSLSPYASWLLGGREFLWFICKPQLPHL